MTSPSRADTLGRKAVKKQRIALVAEPPGGLRWTRRVEDQDVLTTVTVAGEHLADGLPRLDQTQFIGSEPQFLDRTDLVVEIRCPGRSTECRIDVPDQRRHLDVAVLVAQGPQNRAADLAFHNAAQ